MKVKKFLRKNKTEDEIAILHFDERGDLKCELYANSKSVEKQWLKAEVKDTTQEVQCLEIWI